jgi:hypothetical protein
LYREAAYVQLLIKRDRASALPFAQKALQEQILRGSGRATLARMHGLPYKE